MAVFARETEASIEFSAPFVILPDLVEPSFARQAAQRATFMNIAFRVTVKFQEVWLLAPVPSIRENHQYFALRLFQNNYRVLNCAGLVNDFDQE